jgi:hypothetical protein
VAQAFLNSEHAKLTRIAKSLKLAEQCGQPAALRL